VDDLCYILESLEYDSGIRIEDAEGNIVFINKGIDCIYTIMFNSSIHTYSSIKDAVEFLRRRLITPYRVYEY
jgi:hypothetical protein